MPDPLFTVAQMRALEAAAIDSGTVSGLELMERAGCGAVQAILARWPKLAAAPGRAVVLCGPGNNGGDGFVVARLLARKGWHVAAFLLGDPTKMPPDARANYDRWTAMGTVAPLDACTLDHLSTGDGDRPLIVDAFFGTGLSRPPPRAVTDILSMTQPYRRVALDMPSVLNADTGRTLIDDTATIPAAHLTLAFHRRKLGHVLGDGPALCGKVVEIEIGLPDGPTDVVRTVAIPCLQKRAGHKYDHGHTLVLSGGMGRSGAARLAARGALRVGSGLVTLAAPGNAMMECAAQITAIMLRRCDGAGDLSGLLEDRRLNALCLGPGLGMDARAEGLVEGALSSGRACVLDADALTILAGRADLSFPEGCVLTPHDGEFSRLFPDLADKLDRPDLRAAPYSKVDAARDASQRCGGVVLLKGPATIIAAPDGRVAINDAIGDRSAPWLATAGSGDVLAGLIAGLLARGLSPFDATCAGAWLHVEAARAFGPGLIAEDLPEKLPDVFAALEN
ncbi:MAG: NAD(P)H-hydrate dehydratase [Pseudomonadota bacterium]